VTVYVSLIAGEYELDRFPIAGEVFKRLYPHQRKGIEWLWSLHKTRAGGILGDDMGMVCVCSMF
jgi:SNF2 family DNA or RNA helicase